MQLFKDLHLFFGSGGSALGEFLPLPLSDLRPTDVLELQVTEATSDGAVEVYTGASASADLARRRARVAALAYEPAHASVRLLAESSQLSIRCTNTTGTVAVQIRQYR